MRRLIITETDAGQWVAETSAGTRWFAATLDSLLEKMAPAGYPTHDADALLSEVFVTIQPSTTGNIGRGQAAG